VDSDCTVEKVVEGLETTSDKVRALARAGYPRTEISKLLEIRYQHVRKGHCHAATNLRSFWSPGSQRDGEDQLRWIPVPAGDH
jgi:hypothetical protein